MLKRCIRAALGVFLTFMLLLATGCNKIRARYELNSGVQAYKNGRYDDASAHFENALRLDPSLKLARLYLAASYRSDMGTIDTPEAKGRAEQAIEQYKKTVEKQSTKSDRIATLKRIASLYFDLKKFDQAKGYQQKVLEQDPADPEAYYAIGVIDWTQAFVPNQELRTQLHLKPDAPLNDQKACEQLRTKNQTVVKEGVDVLNQAINLRKDYDDALAYLNLMYRQKADIECGDPALRLEDLKQADRYVEQAMAFKKRRAEEEMKQAGLVTDQNK